jgi:light-regulated signal transduction histidine kinase (bacteriophytochrome)
MEGFEENWNYVGNRNFVTYTNLSPGSYSFMVKGSNNDGIWNEIGTSLKIRIMPPFWMTTWFRIISVLLIIGISLWGYKYRMDRVKKVNRELEDRVQERTDQLEQSNKEIESFTYSVSHDLRAPLRAMNGFSNALMEDNFEHLDEQGKDYLRRIQSASSQMGKLIDELLKLSRISKSKLRLEKVNLSEMVHSILNSLKQNNPDRKTNFIISPMLRANADKGLIEIMFKNLLGNAWKFTSKRSISEIEFGETNYNIEKVFYIKDNGIGFDMKYVNKLFEPFQRQNKEYDGTGIGLTIVNRIIDRHKGRIWAEGKIDEGATFYFKI